MRFKNTENGDKSEVQENERKERVGEVEDGRHEVYLTSN
jgi:hypothetical protein